ncbi:hypothetical protein, partial [Oculatella sp. LEGE 06141]|uniref:hypothetical protein n=1 Tax=Oculatella sp. LEGE 06141 TaxID=1828648 RepID=UPI001D1550EC
SCSNRIIEQRKLSWITSELGFQNNHERQDSNLVGTLYHKQEYKRMQRLRLSLIDYCQSPHPLRLARHSSQHRPEGTV